MLSDKQRVWELLNKLSFERVTGIEAELKAAKILKDECEKNQVEAYLETYEIEMPEVYKATLTVLEPTYRQYECIGVGKSGDTGLEGIEAEFIYLDLVSEVSLNKIRNKICLVNERLRPKMIKQLVDHGAAGVISISGSFMDDEYVEKEIRPRKLHHQVKDNLPAVVMHIKDVEEMLLTHPKKVRLVLSQNKDKKSTSQNVVAVIQGTDLKEEEIIFTAHYDSVPYSKGVWDNATGSVTIMEILRHYQKNRPRRTVRFVWCGSEEIGLKGSKEYCKAHKDELNKAIMNINFDMTGATVGYDVCSVSGCEEVVRLVEKAAQQESKAIDIKLDVYSSDSTSFAYAGVPACTFARLAVKGGAQIHSRYDTIDHLDAGTFMNTLEFALAFADKIINSDINLIPRTFDENVLKKLEERRKRIGEQ